MFSVLFNYGRNERYISFISRSFLGSEMGAHVRVCLSGIVSSLGFRARMITSYMRAFYIGGDLT